MKLLRAVLANPALLRLEVVWASVSLVRWALAILVALYAYRAGGPGAVGVAAVARIAPAALLTPRLVLTADRHSRQRVLMVSMGTRLVLTAAMAAAVYGGSQVWLVALLAAGWFVADAVHKPAQLALMATVARTPGQLGAANALWAMVDNGGFLVASLTVGVVVALAGLAEAFAVLVVPLGLAIVALLAVPVDPALPPIAEPGAGSDLLAGLRLVRAVPQLRTLIGLGIGNGFVQATLDVLLVVIAVSLLRMGEQGAGWLSSAWGVGAVLGGIAATTVLARHGLPVALRWGLVLAGVPLVAIALAPHVATALSALLVVGLGFGMVEVSLLTLGQRLVPCDVMARVYGVEETCVIVAMAAASLLTSALIEVCGQRGALAIAGALFPLLALVLWPRLRALDHHVEGDDSAYEVVRGVPAFASLPVASVESLASRSRRIRFEAGVDIVRQGDPGTAFFVIEEGQVDVFEDDIHRRVEGPGEHFGEIALLRDVPRTATVRAKGPVTLLVLERPEFLAAVGAYARARHTLDEVASSRLGAKEL